MYEYWHRTKNAISSDEGHKHVISKLFSGILKCLFYILTSELALEVMLLSSTVLSLLKEDKQFQQYDYRAWQLHPT